MVITIVRAEVSRCEPRGLSIGHKRQLARTKRLDVFCLSANGSYLETGILRALENLKSVKSEEHLSSILPSWNRYEYESRVEKLLHLPTLSAYSTPAPPG